MPTENVLLDANVIVPVLEPMREVNEHLLSLLSELSKKDWDRPTVHPGRDVKDLAAHLLHGSFRRVTSLRDQYRRPGPKISGLDDLIAFIQKDNSEFMHGMRRISPQILMELISTYDALMLTLFEQLDPDADGLGVAWAGENISRNWFDIAREYSEKWHHQQQIRDAIGRDLLYQSHLFEPVLETFARGLPFAFRRLPGPGSISVLLTGEIDYAWTLRRTEKKWELWKGKDSEAATIASLPADMAWRIWTKGIERNLAMEKIQITGDSKVAEAIISFVAIMA